MRIKCTVCKCLIVLFLCSWASCFAASEQDDAIGIVLEVLKGDDPEMKAVAIAMVKEMPGTEITVALARELPNLSPGSGVQLLSALGDRGDAAALPAVVGATKAADASVRIAALKALGQLGDESVVSLLAETAASAGGDEQKAARDSLYRLRSPKVDHTILAAISGAEAKTKVELIGSIAQRNIAAGLDVLLETAQDSDRKVRQESFKALKVIAEPGSLSSLVKLLLDVRTSSDRTEAEKTVAAVAHKIEDKNRQAETVLKVLPSVEDTVRRSSLLSVLGRIGDSSALPELRKALGSSDADIKGSAIRALAGWPTSEPAPDLLAVARSSENKLHQVLALRGCVQLLGVDSVRPAGETVEMYRKAMSLAPNASERKRVLAGLGNTGSPAAMQMAADYLDDEALHLEAELAVIKISQGIYGSYPSQTREVLEAVIGKTENDSLREQAREIINQIEKFDDYLTAWQVAGPYSKAGTDGTGLFDVAFGPESAGAGDVTWRIMPAGTDSQRPWLLELDKLFGGNNRVAYMRSRVWSEQGQKVRLEVGSDDGVKIWLNGEVVLAQNVIRALTPGQDKIEVDLKEGWNQLLLKVTQGGGEWRLCARLRKPDGSKLEGLKFQAED
jgi:HEAT repeat protein